MSLTSVYPALCWHLCRVTFLSELDWGTSTPFFLTKFTCGSHLPETLLLQRLQGRVSDLLFSPVLACGVQGELAPRPGRQTSGRRGPADVNFTANTHK